MGVASTDKPQSYLRNADTHSHNNYKNVAFIAYTLRKAFVSETMSSTIKKTMRKYTLLAWAGAIFNFLGCQGTTKSILLGVWFPQIVSLLISGAGLVLCILLIQKKNSALQKARIQLLVSAAWAAIGSVIAIAISPGGFGADLSLVIINVIVTIALSLGIWKVWCSDEAEKYASK